MHLFLLLVLCFVAPVASAEPSELPLISSSSTEADLSAIGRIRNWRAGRGGCTGVLIAPRLALTAAHCVAGKRNASFIFDPTDLPNYKRVGISRVIVHPGFKATEEVAGLYSDLAVLVLSSPVPEDYAEPLPLGPRPEPGMDFSIYGFLGPKNPPMQGHPDCQIVQITRGVLGSDCVVGPGMSGSPLLVGQEGDWSVVGIIVAGVKTEDDSIRTLIVEIDRDLVPLDLYEENRTSQN